MGTIAVTGASGHLGRVLVPYLWERGHVVEKVGRYISPDLNADVLIHAAAPDWRDDDAVRAFAPFNEAVARWAEVTGGRVVNIGSWWQYADGDAAALSYSALKRDQAEMFACTVVPFSIYGTAARDGRGFIPQLLAHCRGAGTVTAASTEPRDWLHVRDLCDALRACLRAPDDIYEAATGVQYSAAELLRAMTGERVPVWPDVPSCTPVYRYPRVPGWTPKVNVLTHLARSVGAVA